jgi:hypothetical protein
MLGLKWWAIHALMKLLIGKTGKKKPKQNPHCKKCFERNKYGADWQMVREKVILCRTGIES